jgi:hypothetical protein
MNGLAQRRHGSVTERLSARLDDLEPVVERLLANEAKLIADALTVDARVTQAEQWSQERWESDGATHKRLGDQHRAFVSRSFMARLRWLVRGC